MTGQVARFAQITPPARLEIQAPSASPETPLRQHARRIGKGIWHFLVVAISGPGLGEEYRTIDDSAMPSSYAAPIKRGSRGVRSLTHLYF
jgi:hypothetical protein